MAQSFLQGFQQTFGPAAQQGAQAAQDRAKAEEQSRRANLKAAATLFVQAVQSPNAQGERLFTGVLQILGVPQEQWAKQIKVLRGLDETKRQALAAMATGNNFEENLPHIVNFFGQAGVEMAQASRKRAAERTLRQSLPAAGGAGRPSPLFGLSAPGGDPAGRGSNRFGDLVGYGRRAYQAGVLDTPQFLEFSLEAEKARGQDPLNLMEMYRRLLNPQSGGPQPRRGGAMGQPPPDGVAGQGSAPSGLGVPTLTFDSTGKAAINIDPTRLRDVDEPLSTEDLRKLRRPVTNEAGAVTGFENPPPGTTVRQARAQGYRATPDASGPGARAAPALAIVNDIASLANQLFTTDPGLLNRIKESAKFGQEALTQSDPRVANYLSLTRGAVGLIIRGLGFDVGQITEGDKQAVRKLFPEVWPLTDTKEVAQRKIKRLLAIAQAIKTGDTGKARSLAGIKKTGAKGKAENATAAYVFPDGEEVTLSQIRRRAVKERISPQQVIQKYGLQPAQ